ncbi:MAG: response regulator transcription factor, partial [Clostridiaceae bacterium]
MENNTILVIDDDRNILAIIELYLKKAGFQVYTCADGISALAAFHETKPSLVVLDIMLPGRDGWAVLHDIRMESDTPVIMLTAKGDTGDRVQGLELGADDYISKPFDAKELIARIKAVLRRSTPAEPERTISLPGLTVSLENYAVTLDGRQLEMPPKEIELLYFLASHTGKVF